MCGIVGFLSLHSEAEKKSRLTRMMDSIQHRGPDDGQLWTDENAGLGFRRLSIIDLAAGAQPLSNEDGTVWQIFNGEIYNFRELRDTLKSHGHRFKTQSDSEVIVHGYEQWGDDFVSRLKGMFGIALWDSNKRELTLAVDRVGIKPLYYYQDKNVLAFASEAKALFASGLVPCEADYNTLPFHMTFLTSPFPRTMFKGVHKLEPGHYIKIKDGRITKREYWDLIPCEDAQQWADRPYEKIATSVEAAVVNQSISDVPLGSFLSGGIDSSAVCDALAKYSPSQIETYFIGFRPEDLKEDVLMDERAYATQMANELKSIHHEIDITSDGLEDLLPKLVWHMDEPVGDPAAITTFLVSRAARETLTVLLSGAGGDEVFAGYPRHLAMMLMARFQKLPTPLKWLACRTGKILPGGASSYMRGAKKFLRSAQGDVLDSYLQMLTYFAPSQHRDLFTSDFYNEFCQEDVYRYHRAYADRVRAQPTLNMLQYVDMKTFLPCLNLTYTDRMSMAASIEVRVPLLDDDLVEQMASLPVHEKIRGKQRKYGFKKSQEGRLPDDVIWRKKTGFGAPIQSWIRGELRPIVDELLGEDHLRQQGIFNPKTIQNLLLAEDRKEDYYANHIWQLLTFQLWHKAFINPAS
ncbi:MAG: asparagine synthase (glutamine-hydrolyzing) [Rubripirellula sp.]